MVEKPTPLQHPASTAPSSDTSHIFPVTFIEREAPWEKCGISAWVSKNGKSVASVSRNAQDKLRNRGGDSFGFVAISEDGLPIFKSRPGRIELGFPTADDLPQGDKIIGHNRYRTNGPLEAVQPVIARKEGQWIVLAHNGNIPDDLRAKLRNRIPKEVHDKLTFDSAELTYAILYAEGERWEDKIANALDGIPQAYAFTMMTNTGEVYGMVGPSGHWPLWVGETNDAVGLASENVAFPKGAKMRPVQPGHLIKITPDGYTDERIFDPLPQTYECTVQVGYGANKDSLRYSGESHLSVRESIGTLLAEHYLQNERCAELFGDENTVVIGVPRTGLDYAEKFAERINRPLTEFLILADTSRSFLDPTQQSRDKVARSKLVPNPKINLEGKKVIMVDDSVIRGTMSGPTIQMVKDAGAAEIHIFTGLGKFINGCEYGYAIFNDQLIARDGERIRSDDEIAALLGVDSIHFATEEILDRVIGTDRCRRCMTGEAPKVKARRQLTRRRELVQN